MFKKYDTNRPGALTFKQFDKAWLDLELPGNEVQRKRQLIFIDENDSGYLNFREFVNACAGEHGTELGAFTEIQAIRDYLRGNYSAKLRGGLNRLVFKSRASKFPPKKPLKKNL